MRWYSDDETPSLVSPEPVMQKVSCGGESGKSSGAAEKKIVCRVTNLAADDQGLIKRVRLDVCRYTGPTFLPA